MDIIIEDGGATDPYVHLRNGIYANAAAAAEIDLEEPCGSCVMYSGDAKRIPFGVEEEGSSSRCT